MQVILFLAWASPALFGYVYAHAASKDQKPRPTVHAVEKGHEHQVPLPTPPVDTDPKRHHAVQLQLLRDAKIKQSRQWAEGQPCPTGWLHFNDSCYWGSTNAMSWFAAEHECRNFGYDAHLASVHSSDENNRVQAIAGCGATWIGLTKMNPTQSSGATAGWAWTDMSENDFLAWRSGNPVGIDERNCAYQDKGSAAAGGSGWANGFCTELRAFTCKADAKINGGDDTESGSGGVELPGVHGEATPATERQRESHKATTTKAENMIKRKPKRSADKEAAKKGVHDRDEGSGQTLPNSESPIPCPGGRGWLNGKNGFCYFYSSDKANWFEAEARCRILSGHLLAIKNALEQQLAMLGGCDKRTWLGAVRWQPEERWHWYDDLAYVDDGGSFSNWGQNNTGANYIVAYLDTTGNGAGKWFNTPSAHEPMYYICKQPLFGGDAGEGKNGAGSSTSEGSAASGGMDNEGSGTGEHTGPKASTKKPEAVNSSEGSAGAEESMTTPESEASGSGSGDAPATSDDAHTEAAGSKRGNGSASTTSSGTEPDSASPSSDNEEEEASSGSGHASTGHDDGDDSSGSGRPIRSSGSGHEEESSGGSSDHEGSGDKSVGGINPGTSGHASSGSGGLDGGGTNETKAADNATASEVHKILSLRL